MSALIADATLLELFPKALVRLILDYLLPILQVVATPSPPATSPYPFLSSVVEHPEVRVWQNHNQFYLERVSEPQPRAWVVWPVSPPDLMCYQHNAARIVNHQVWLLRLDHAVDVLSFRGQFLQRWAPKSACLLDVSTYGDHYNVLLLQSWQGAAVAYGSQDLSVSTFGSDPSSLTTTWTVPPLPARADNILAVSQRILIRTVLTVEWFTPEGVWLRSLALRERLQSLSRTYGMLPHSGTLVALHSHNFTLGLCVDPLSSEAQPTWELPFSICTELFVTGNSLYFRVWEHHRVVFYQMRIQD